MAKLINIVFTNEIKGGYTIDATGKTKSVRVSRLKSVRIIFANSTYLCSGGVLELDQTQLVQRYKIKPFADEQTGATRDYNASEFEEVIITDEIKPLPRYLKAIWISNKNISDILINRNRNILILAQDLARLGLIPNTNDEAAKISIVTEYINKLANHPLRRVL